jgi:hypothetical protein
LGVAHERHGPLFTTILSGLTEGLAALSSGVTSQLSDRLQDVAVAQRPTNDAVDSSLRREPPLPEGPFVQALLSSRELLQRRSPAERDADFICRVLNTVVRVARAFPSIALGLALRKAERLVGNIDRLARALRNVSKR